MAPSATLDTDLIQNRIPDDIWKEIAVLLDAFDILSLSMVSRTPHNSLSNRGIWVELLKIMCRKYKLFLLSFAPDSMDIVELKRAVFGNCRWTHLIQRHSLPYKHLERGWKCVQPASRSRVGYSGRFIAQFLVPGGRFLFVNTSNDVEVYVKLWDLGSAGRPPLERPILVSFFESQSRAKSLRRWDICDAGGGKLRMALLLSIDSAITLAVYEVQIDDRPKPVPFTHLGSFAMDQEATIVRFKIIGNRVLIYLGHRVVVWNLVSRRYYNIRINWGLIDYPIHFVGDFVLQVRSEWPSMYIHVWQVPNPTEPRVWHSAPFSAAEVVDMTRQLALDMPESTTISSPLSHTPEEDFSEMSFPTLWDGGDDTHFFPLIYSTAVTVRRGSSHYVKSVSLYKLDVFREAEAHPGRLKCTLDPLATFDIGDQLCPSLEYKTYAYINGSKVIPAPSLLIRAYAATPEFELRK
ncbi:hypothetical protein EST38_g4395 [Candolleomyces aberdarensis]|uniref:F-box domain-containing protein n=1 Tax=Candolleomyces aberdarensis TaxID=2316362 RepID=A0A4Q2DMQ1_9AGAR|nr:hypothetical protein EST38_g4395 [Candolleomyces aberdarensis]